jgi:hypothetical protein
MLIPTPPKFQRRRSRRLKRTQANPTPPVTENVIVSVTHGAQPHQINVTVTNLPVDITEWATAFQVRTGIGGWQAATGGTYNENPMIIDFGGDVSDTSEWRVLDFTAWEFFGGEHLDVPWNGGIE